jgi:Type III restriction enzyme, res subunit
MNFFNVIDLEKRDIPIPKKDRRIFVQEEQMKEGEGEVREGEEELIEKKRKLDQIATIVKDYRDIPTTKVNRALLLERVRMPSPEIIVEPLLLNRAPSKSPVVRVEESNKVVTDVEVEVEDENEVTDKDKEQPELEIEKEVGFEKDESESESEEEGEEEEEAQEPKVKRPRVKKMKQAIPDEAAVNLSTAMIRGKPVMKRLPKPTKFKVGVSPYYMNNRKIFVDQLAKIFKPYQDKIAERGAEISCKTARNEDIDFELLTHQLVVRQYLNTYTPYRGLLLYHGLGSGKTCTSIGIAEGMKTNKQIVLMTPASLKVNFFSELKKCGDILYKKNQYWEFISIDGEPQSIPILSQVLGLPQTYIREHGGAWLVNVTKKSNFKSLSDNDQKNIDEQLDAMIRAKYKDYNYNGLRETHMEEMTQGGKINPFDHKVVIIDEAHNLVSRISNSRGSKDSISQRLYQYLLTATDCKIVFLTGTPIINQPSEIGLLFNMLRGGIKTWQFSIKSEKKVTKPIIMDILKESRFAYYDYLEYSGDTLTVTRNPFGFVSTYVREPAGGGGRGGKRGGKSQKKRQPKKSNKKTHRRRPNTPEFVEESGIIKQNHIFDKVDGEGEVDLLLKDIKKTDYLEGGGVFEDYQGVQYDENGNISDAEFERRLVRILKENGIEAIPLFERGAKTKKLHKIETCLPEDPKIFNENFINGTAGELVHTDLLKRRILGLTSYFRSAQEELLPSFEKTASGENYHIVPIDMSEYQFGEYQRIRAEERENESKRKKKAKKPKADDEQDLPSSYRIYSRSACNFCFPEEYPRPKVTLKSGKDINENIFNGLTKQMEESKDDYLEGEDRIDKEDEEVVKDYQARIKDALDYLSASDKLITGRSEGLSKYSAKFAQIVENLQKEEYRGLHLLYSQFRTLEGIGILKIILEKNGFVEFKLSKTSGDWTIDNFDESPEKPRFVLYTGTETAEEKEIIRNIFNSSWELVPPTLVTALKRRHENNIYGELIKLMMITSSGAEGINLRNTRYVHIVEPYWNMVRIDQVVGRASRICSHEDLPEELRTVKVMIYLSRLTEDQIQLDGNIEMKLKDISKREYEVKVKGKKVKKHLVFTTDEYLFEIAQIKDSINRQILTAVKETAMDCFLYNKNPDEPLICYNYGSVTKNDFGSYPGFEVDKAYDPKLEVAKKTMELVTIELDGVKYKMNKQTNIVYSMDSYEKMKAGIIRELETVGKLVMITEKVDGEKVKVPKIVAV